MAKRADLVGKRFGKLVVREFTGNRTSANNALWLADCDCGGIRITSTNSLNSGRTVSCGCHQKQRASEANRLGSISNGLTKTCARCRIDLPLNSFTKRNQAPDGFHPYCRVCAKDAEMQLKYGISRSEYNGMIKEQNNCCKVCLKPLNEKDTDYRKRVYIDHCHVTGKVRGILCLGCNTSLGMMRENVDKLRKLLAYCIKHKQAV